MGPGVTTYTFGALSADTLYEFIIESTDQHKANIVTVRTLPGQIATPAYIAPGGMSATATSNTNVALNWTANGSPTGVHLWRNGGNLGDIGAVTTRNQYQDPGTTATYKVQNIYSGNGSAFSNEVTVITPSVNASINNPTALSGYSTGTSSIELSWVSNGGNGATIYFRKGGDSFNVAGSVGGAAQSFTKTGLLPDTTYDFYVVNNNGNMNSNITSITTDVFVPTGGSDCIALDMYALVKRSGGQISVLATEVKDADTLVSFSPNGTVYEAEIDSISRGYASGIYSLITESGHSLRCSPTHPIIMGFGDETGKAMHRVKTGENVLVYNINSTEAVESKVVAIEYLDRKEEVLIFHLKNGTCHTFAAGAERSGGIVSHNRKPVDVV
jgi:hypothetical protein